VHDPFRHSIEWVEAWQHWEAIKKKGKVPCLEIRYETLISNPGQQLARVAKFLGLNNPKPFVATFKRKVKGSVGNWRKQQPHIEAQMHPSIFPLMERLGYRRGR
jgi:LPS sulfotransferase NodH